MRDSVQDWRKKCFYVKDEPTVRQRYGLSPYDDAAEDDIAEDEVKNVVHRLTNLKKLIKCPSLAKLSALTKTILCLRHAISIYLLDFLFIACSHVLHLFFCILQDHRFLSSLPPLPEGGSIPEAIVSAESEAADTGATPDEDDDDEEDM
jgi:hypothetical protein